PALSAAGGLSVITSGYANPTTKIGVNIAAKVYDTDNSANNSAMAITTANAKALGYTGFAGSDASITFSSQFAFDFDPRGCIAANSYDFIGIATHEIGHALGFVSGVDTYDYFGPRGPGAGTTLNLNDYAIASTLDLFRYAKDPTNLVAGTAPVLDWSVGGAPYFSVDGGATMLNTGTGTALFATGGYNGNGRQASHWTDNRYGVLTNGCQARTLSRGLLDPTSGKCELLAVSSLDLAAFDAIGWNLADGSRDVSNIRFTTAQIANLPRTGVNIGGVPEPATWSLLVLGFGSVGALLRRQREAAA
ncbi:MAG: PEPxxWA-CTERM sorting domain-containing protein, partial [Sandarakinorhabdus sp.]|nr:PEPxxWA-CTERM sorting domain-containing protein [Sandarakinorhabdus sp.]